MLIAYTVMRFKIKTGEILVISVHTTSAFGCRSCKYCEPKFGFFPPCFHHFIYTTIVSTPVRRLALNATAAFITLSVIGLLDVT